MSDPQPPEGVLHEYRPSCARSDCTEWPATGRPFCKRHEDEIAGAVKPGLSEEQWVGGVDPAVAQAKADALEAQFAEQERLAAVEELAKKLMEMGDTEETARKKAEFHLREKMAWNQAWDQTVAEAGPVTEQTTIHSLRYQPVGPDPDTIYPSPPQPIGPTEELAFILECLKGKHGAIRETLAVTMMATLAAGLRAL